MTRPRGTTPQANRARTDELPAVARPWVENLLHTYAELCDLRDSEALGRLLADATVKFGDAEPTVGRAAVTALYARLFADAGRTQHLLSNLIVTEADHDRVTTRTAYTRWTLDPAPTMVGMGHYLSEFVLRGANWIFTGHNVRRDWLMEQR